MKRLVQAHRDHHRVPLDYTAGAPRIWLTTDGSVSGIVGKISQGDEWEAAKVAAKLPLLMRRGQGASTITACKGVLVQVVVGTA